MTPRLNSIGFVFIALILIGTGFGFLNSTHTPEIGDMAAPSPAPEPALQPLPRNSFAKPGFSLRFKEEISSLPLSSTFLLPGQRLDFEVLAADAESHQVTAPEGELETVSSRKWSWRAPEKSGIFPILISGSEGEAMRLNAVVMVPAGQMKKGRLNGYRIGSYPPKPLKENPVYAAPVGFIEVTEDNQDTFLTPHFQLKQFLCKQAGSYPKYVLLQERLLFKLEILLEEVNRRGFSAETLHVMSGYRTPSYNRAIGNVKFSMHQYGGAADVFVDSDGDGLLDDLDKDGRVSFQDAALMAQLVEDLNRDPAFKPFIGGLGKYKANSQHGPFIHVDIRGRAARW